MAQNYETIFGLVVILSAFFIWRQIRSYSRRRNETAVAAYDKYNREQISKYTDARTQEIINLDTFSYFDFDINDFRRLFEFISGQPPDDTLDKSNLRDAVLSLFAKAMRDVAYGESCVKHTATLAIVTFNADSFFKRERAMMGYSDSDTINNKRILNIAETHLARIKNERDIIAKEAKQRRLTVMATSHELDAYQRKMDIKLNNQERLIELQTQHQAITQQLLSEHEIGRLSMLKEQGDFYQEQIRAMQKILSE